MFLFNLQREDTTVSNETRDTRSIDRSFLFPRAISCNPLPTYPLEPLQNILPHESLQKLNNKKIENEQLYHDLLCNIANSGGVTESTFNILEQFREQLPDIIDKFSNFLTSRNVNYCYDQSDQQTSHPLTSDNKEIFIKPFAALEYNNLWNTISDREAYDNEIKESNDALRLGKRGRFYRDIWDDENFLYDNDLDDSNLLSEWNAIFRNYNDSHNGTYKSEMKRTIMNKKRNNKSKKYSTTMKLLPSVPSAIHHPAAWGIGCRISSTGQPLSYEDIENNVKINLGDQTSSLFERYHPACMSSTVVHPPGYTIDICKQSNESGNDNCSNKKSCERHDDSTVENDLTAEVSQHCEVKSILPTQLLPSQSEDFDEVQVLFHLLSNEYNTARDYCLEKLKKLQAYGANSQHCQQLKRKRETLEHCLYSVMVTNAPNKSNRDTYLYKPESNVKRKSPKTSPESSSRCVVETDHMINTVIVFIIIIC
jgi:hypothetical protein